MPLLPLFPLGSVLFPGGTLPLHIFEERYRLMIGECLTEERPFGVVLIRRGVEVGGSAEPYMVGTTARIKRAERHPDGRMDIVTVGAERFKAVTLEYSRPYPSADVVYSPRAEGAAGACDTAMALVRALFSEQFRLTLALGNQWSSGIDLPLQPVALADFVAGRLDADEHVKQKLLEIDAVQDCLETEAAMLADNVRRLVGRVKAAQRSRYAGFGATN